MAIGYTGLIGYGTGPAGKTRINRVGPTPAPKVIKTRGNAVTPKSTFCRGSILRGRLGKRGR